MTPRRRIALLRTAPPESDFDARFGSWELLFARLCGGGRDVLFVPHDAYLGAFPSLDRADALVVPGGVISTRADDAWLSGLFSLLRDAVARDIPVVGVCFGHQALATALGGVVRLRPDGFDVGMRDVHWIAGPIAKTNHPVTRIYMSHEEEVSRLPPGAELLATSEHAHVQAFRFGSALGIQGHPEFTPGVARHYLDRNTLGLKPRQLAAARASLAGSDDHLRIGRLVGDWLRGRIVRRPAPAELR